jgi:adenylate kinase
MNLIIFGPQGSGKGTQAELMAEKYGLVHVETGLIFREIGRENSDLGRKIKELNDNKEMIPDHITIDVLRTYLEKIPAEKGVILDSAPRTQGQIELVEDLMRELGRKIAKAIYITLPYEESVARITKRYACTVCYRHFVLGKDIANTEAPCPTCNGPIMQRPDDTPDGIAKRLKVFYEVTIPVVEHYRAKGVLIEVDGNRAVQDVFIDIIEKI